MSGSIRQRGAASWEVRVYAGIDLDTRKARYRSATVHGNRADATRGVERLIAEVSSVKAIGSSSTVSELLEAWFAIGSVSWAPTTIRQTRSVLDRYLHPHLGGQRVGDVTPAFVDATPTLRVRGGVHGKPLRGAERAARRERARRRRQRERPSRAA
jgi:hypothetical protein